MTTQTVDLPPFTVDLTRPDPQARVAWVVHNPTAGSGLGKRAPDLEAVRVRFHALGWGVAFVATRCAGDGAAAARHALEQGAEVVVAMGGDGTVNEVVQTLALGEVPLGILPAGTINVLARELGIPLDPVAAVNTICTGEPTQIDLGKANDRYFTMMIGLGYDAESTLAMIPSIKQWSGQIAYWVAAFQSFGRHKSVRSTIIIHDGKRRRRIRRLVYMMVVSNCGLYGDGALKFNPNASLRDGVLDCCLIRSARWYRALLHLALTFLGRLRSVTDVEFYQLTSLTMKTSRPFPYQLDGDSAGMTPVTITVAPAALKVLVANPPLMESAAAGHGIKESPE